MREERTKEWEADEGEEEALLLGGKIRIVRRKRNEVR